MGLELGPCQVLYGTAGAEVDFGKTEGGVIAHHEILTKELFSDQDGEAPYDEVITGIKAWVEVPLAEVTLTNIATIFGYTLKHLAGKSGFWGTDLVGTRLRALGQSLILKKYVSGVPSTDSDDWLTYPLASLKGAVELTYDKNTQRVLKAVFVAFKDDSNHWFLFGTEAAADS